MFIKQLYTNCLSEAAYFIESNGQAAVIDPLRDIDVYLQLAKERNAEITYIFETHFHADFVSGHLELAAATKAPIVFGPNTETNFPIHLATDGERFSLGKATLKALHTPGHTVESTCYLLINEEGKDEAIFTGDTLFIGDVGRPDLSSGNLTSQALASMMYDSLQTKILPLADDVVVYPAHGPGSSCGKNIGAETQSTIAHQKSTNYALQPQSREDFINAVTQGLATAPKYFSINAEINKQGYPALTEVMQSGLNPISVPALKALIQEGETVILDTRPAIVFTQGFVPSSVFIGLEGRFAEWAGSLLPFNKSIVLITLPNQETETITRLARVGFSKITGHLQGGFDAWQQAGEKVDMIIDVDPDELAMDMPFDEKLIVVDVRKEAEFGSGHVRNAVNLSLDTLTDPGSMAMIEDNMNLYIHCAGGYRSTIASSLLKKEGFHNLRNVLGGWEKLKHTKGIKTEKEQSVLN